MTFFSVEKFCNELQQQEVRDRLMHESQPKWQIDLKQKDKDAPAESFRRLNVD